MMKRIGHRAWRDDVITSASEEDQTSNRDERHGQLGANEILSSKQIQSGSQMQSALMTAMDKVSSQVVSITLGATNFKKGHADMEVAFLDARLQLS